jgi:outer membrane biogenesis lipoprotein LolB
MRLGGIAILCGLVVFILTGCAQYQAQQQAQAADQAQAQAASDDAQCQSYGVSPGSPGYVQCRMNLDNQHAAAFQQRQAILGAYLLRH